MVRLASVAAALLGAGCHGSAPEPETAAGATTTTAAAAATSGRDDFEAAAVGATPPGFLAATTIGDRRFRATLAHWKVAADPDAASGGQIVQMAETKNREEIFNLLLREQPRLADVALSVWIRPDGGLEDRGGGLVWRALDAQNYYLCRWNPIEKNLRAYAVVAGRRIQLLSVAVAAEAGTWHLLAVTMAGRRIEIDFDGQRTITCADATFAEPGMVGLWTKADALSSFDDFAVQ